MELVYLWVEEYKNIRNQGFNFSPRFECEYDGENLKVCDKKKNECKNNEYLENFFGKNTNVTAIVGENGSGKSSIYELLFNLIHNEEINNLKAYIVIYNDKENDYFCSDSNIKINGNIKLKLDQTKHFLLLLDLVYSPWTIVNSKDKSTYKENYALEPSRILSNSSLANKMDINGFDSNLKSFGFYGYMFLKNSNIKNNFSEKLKELKKVEIKKRDDDKITRLENFMILITLNQQLIQEINKYFPMKTTNINIVYIKNIYDLYEQYKLPLTNKKDIKESFKLFLNSNKHFESDLTKYLIILDEAIHCKKTKYKITTIYEDFKNLYLLFSLYNFEIVFVDNTKFKDLSSGQTTLLLYIGYIARYIRYFENKKESFTIIIDECETSLHPNWQKQTVKFFLDSVKNEILKNLKINLIFISHSPFILSDIPKENVIFLEKYHEKDKEILKEKYPTLNIKDLKDGDCINVSEHVKLKTFGANIHSLLSDGFFMNDGLMGEFAKSKINEIKDFYAANKNLKKEDFNFKSKKDEFEKNKKYFENIQKIIGEPFLQTIIKNYLDELEILFNGKKEFLDKEIKRLKELRKSLNDKA